MISPCPSVVFGASGDLAKKMVSSEIPGEMVLSCHLILASSCIDPFLQTFPSLFQLYKEGLLPKQTKIIGYARSDMDEEKFMSQVAGGLKDEASPSQVVHVADQLC